MYSCDYLTLTFARLPLPHTRYYTFCPTFTGYVAWLPFGSPVGSAYIAAFPYPALYTRLPVVLRYVLPARCHTHWFRWFGCVYAFPFGSCSTVVTVTFYRLRLRLPVRFVALVRYTFTLVTRYLTACVAFCLRGYLRLVGSFTLSLVAVYVAFATFTVCTHVRTRSHACVCRAPRTFCLILVIPTVKFCVYSVTVRSI